MKQLVVRHHRPHVLILSALLVGALLSAAGWWLYRSGMGDATLVINRLQSDLEEIRLERAQQEQQLNQLREQGTIMTRERQIDRAASVHIDGELSRLNDEVAELRGELEFYRGIVVADEERKGLSARGFVLSYLQDRDEYQYRFVLTKVPNDGRLTRGSNNMVVEGKKGDTKSTFKVKSPSGAGSSKASAKFRFKYFQSINGRLSLPDGFTPSKVTVTLNPKGKRQKKVVEVFDWAIEES